MFINSILLALGMMAGLCSASYAEVNEIHQGTNNGLSSFEARRTDPSC
jgi:hypothetical protein